MKKLFSAIAVLLLFAMSFTAMNVFAAVPYDKCVSLLSVRKNETGNGYQWDNYDKVLTIKGLNIQTSDDYGLKIPDGAVVVIKGENKISASKSAIFIEGKVIFKGDGNLILEGENGIYCSSNDRTDTLAINGGKINISASSFGILSQHARVATTECELNINTKSDIAIDAARLNISVNTDIVANGSLKGVNNLTIDGANIEVTSNQAALLSSADIILNKVSIKAGSSKSDMKDIKAYNNELCIKTKSTYDGSKKSLIFGDNVGAWADAAFLALVIAVLCSSIAIPISIRKKRALKVIDARDSMNTAKRK